MYASVCSVKSAFVIRTSAAFAIDVNKTRLRNNPHASNLRTPDFIIKLIPWFGPARMNLRQLLFALPEQLGYGVKLSMREPYCLKKSNYKPEKKQTPRFLLIFSASYSRRRAGSRQWSCSQRTTSKFPCRATIQSFSPMWIDRWSRRQGR